MKQRWQRRAAGWFLCCALAAAAAGCGGGGPTKSVTAPPPDATGAMNATAGAVMNTSGPQGPGGVIAVAPK